MDAVIESEYIVVSLVQIYIEINKRHVVNAECHKKTPRCYKLVEHHTAINDERLAGHIVGVRPGKI